MDVCNVFKLQSAKGKRTCSFKSEDLDEERLCQEVYPSLHFPSCKRMINRNCYRRTHWYEVNSSMLYLAREY